MSKRLFWLLATGLILFQVFFPFNTWAQGNLLITPKRVVFEGNKRSVDISLANIGDDTATYAISFIQIRMTEEGNFESITEPDEGQLFASPYLRYFPRSVTLGPNEAQAVKVQLVRGAGLDPGEYRSHLYFRAVPQEKPLGEEEEPAADPTSISVKIIPIFGITIPAIIRVGQPSVRVTLSDLDLRFENDTLPKLTLTFNRSGSYSIYGDITVDHISAGGVSNRVGIANGFAVYTPNAKRHFELNLINTTGIDLKSGKLVVTYSAPSDVKPEKYATAELMLSQK
jgi:P pilus assembly chaperone PapD